MNLLRESGPAELENGIKRKGGDAKKRKAGGGVGFHVLLFASPLHDDRLSPLEPYFIKRRRSC